MNSLLCLDGDRAEFVLDFIGKFSFSLFLSCEQSNEGILFHDSMMISIEVLPIINQKTNSK